MGATVPEDHRAKLADRRARILRMRSSGMTWQQIADEIGREVEGTYTSRHAFTDGKRALEDAQKYLGEMANLHLALEMERLDAYVRVAESTLAQARQAGERWLVLRTLDRLVKLGERRDSLLGLSRTTIEATRATESGGERPHATDGVDEVARKRAARRIAT